MRNVDDFIAACNDAARHCGALPLPAPAPAPVRGVVYRRVWPTAETLNWMDELGLDSRGACQGWLDSSLDLRDGLSVVEVFAAPVVADDHFAELAH